MSNSPDEVMDAVYYVLEPHSSFIHNGNDDNVKYFIPPEILEILAWIALNVSMPILLGVTTSVLSESFKKKDDKKLKAMELQKAELEQLKADVQKALKELDEQKKPSKENILIARASLADILKINGWTSEMANTDAEKAVLQIQNTLWKDMKD